MHVGKYFEKRERLNTHDETAERRDKNDTRKNNLAVSRLYGLYGLYGPPATVMFREKHVERGGEICRRIFTDLSSD